MRVVNQVADLEDLTALYAPREMLRRADMPISVCAESDLQCEDKRPEAPRHSRSRGSPRGPQRRQSARRRRQPARSIVEGGSLRGEQMASGVEEDPGLGQLVLLGVEVRVRL